MKNHLIVLRSSFSSVSTATIARKDAFCSIFRDLQDLHSFAPLRYQFFSKNFVSFSFFPTFSRYFHFFVIFQQKMMNFAQNFTKRSEIF